MNGYNKIIGRMSHNMEIFIAQKAHNTLKISNFSPRFDHHLLFKEEDERTRKLHSSFAARLSPEALPVKPRNIQTSHHPRLQKHQSQPLPSDTQERYNENLPGVGENMRELKQLMKAKIAAIKEMTRVNNNLCYFSQYKMKGAERDRWNLSTLHSRKVSESPFARSAKQKKMAIESRYHQETRIIPLKSKREKSRKMVLIGGSIPVRAISTNPEQQASFSPLKTARRQLKNHQNSFRQAHQPRSISMIQRYENDCKPWQISRGMQQSNLYLYQR